MNEEFKQWWTDPTRIGSTVTPEEIFLAGIKAGILKERKRLSELPAVAWTGKGCGLLSVNGKSDMVEGEHYGGEFAIAARTAREHDIALIHRPNLTNTQG